jgi:hypothetical protein
MKPLIVFSDVTVDGFIAGQNETPENSLADDASEVRSQAT